MKPLKAVGVSAVGTAAAMALFASGVATADGYAGQTYTAAVDAATAAGQTVIVATRTGARLSQHDCIVTRSQPAAFKHGNTHVTDTVLFDLNCNGGHATSTNPGSSLLSPEGRASKATAEKAG
jgi:hypothetical protein